MVEEGGKGVRESHNENPVLLQQWLERVFTGGNIYILYLAESNLSVFQDFSQT